MKMNRTFGKIALIMVLISALFLSACTGADEPQKTTEPLVTDQPVSQTEPEKETDPVTEDLIKFTDSVGREVDLPANIDRIVPSGPLAQQILLSLAADKIVALPRSLKESEAHYIGEKYLDLPEVGQFFGEQDMNMEELASLNPQVVIDIGEVKEGIADDMDTITKQTGIPAIFIEADLVNSGDAFRILGELLGLSEKGVTLGDYCDRVYRDVTETMSNIAEEDRPTFAYLLGENGLNALAEGTYHATIMDMVGRNTVVVDNPSSRGSGDEINMEQLLIWDPEYIFFASGSVYSEASDNPAFSSLKAIREGKYCEVPGEPYSWLGAPPSVNRYIGLQWMAHILYPEYFTEDMKTVTQEYYKLFYDYDLSDAEYSEMVENSFIKD